MLLLAGLARVGTWDPTNSFKAYDRHFVKEVGIDSDKGFEVGLELVAKASGCAGPWPSCRPSGSTGVWRVEFQHGQMAARLFALVPFAFGPKLASRPCERPPGRTEKRKNDEGPGVRVGRFHRRLCRRRAVPRGYEVIGVDNFSKYGPVKRPYDAHPSYRFVEGDCRDTGLLDDLLLGLTISSPVRP